MYETIGRSVCLSRSLLGESASGIIVNEQVELTHALRDRNKAEALVPERCPARNPEQLRC
jgi:hypothetical protein